MTARPVKILHFIESEGVYGAERVILNLSTQMHQAGSAFIPVVGCIVPHIETESALFNAAQAAGISAIKIPIANKSLWLDIPRAARQLKSLNIDLIHSHGYKPSVFGFFIRLLKKIPVIATCHLWFEPSKGPLKMRVMISMEKFFYRWFPKVIAVSEPIKTILLENGLTSSQTEVVRNGVDIPVPNIRAEESIRRELAIDKDMFVILNSARLSRQKAQWVLIEAAAILKNVNIPLKVLIVGQGGLEPELRSLINAKGLEQEVLLLGFRNDVNYLLQTCNVFALPSIDEGMPMSLLEAAAASKPIVTTQVGDIGKLIKHEQSGLIIPLEDPQSLAQALIRLREDTRLAQQLAQTAHHEMRENYSSEAMCKRYMEIYQQLSLVDAA
jgi:glycosyltransferase involved in cell wall biosynthesis